MTPGLILAALATLCFAGFSWAAFGHFRRTHAGLARGALAITAATIGGYASFLAHLRYAPADGGVAAGLCFLAALGLFAWAIIETRRQRPTAAFSADRPVFLVQGGPYRAVRHPFYTSYLVFWLGCALAAPQAPVPWAVLALMVGLYVDAAHREEAKFAASPLARRYAAYRRMTGMFLPRLGPMVRALG